MLTCTLCKPVNEIVLWQGKRCRVILVGDPDYPGFCRVIWNEHVKEMTDLNEPEQAHFLAVVFATERVLRKQLHPAKINLASLGNQIPHLHWHVIPRFTDDAHFPDPVWSDRRRESSPTTLDSTTLARELTGQLNDQME
ncbi:MAG: HIT family protein [Gammaproteobacteria bacterium]|nr:HIT family protein [Gammaproteobacteria bacterium]MDH3371253.1 HIT family protein [Gammaproteobacteria bacterium]MDH3405894.1 HIT family protein [Gammaproteobacteria bacterium]MDH3562627.1 HIT family protein [Gammaproteobacteria bacterium]MDH5486397.1 HIT family protein [Gammaproteobacteria bacterium]